MSVTFEFLDKRPIVIAIAGSNGAGKLTFYQSFLADSGLRFVNADVLAQALSVSAYEAFERTQANLKRVIERLPHVIVYSNDDLTYPYKLVELYENGKSISI